MTATAGDDRYTKMTQAQVDAICARHERLRAMKPGGARAVFAWCDLSGLSLANRVLTDSDFTACILTGCDLSRAVLDTCNLYCADLQVANLTGASMRRADLRGACLRGANLSDCDLYEADLREGALALPDKQAGLSYVEIAMRSSEASYANLRGANLERSKLSGIQAMKADFTDATMKSCKLVRANLRQCIMDNVDLAGADLSGADLSGASLKDAVLIGAKTDMWRTAQADMTGMLTDKVVGMDVKALPYGDMLRDHALWVDTLGKDGKPSKFDNADLRGLVSIKGLNLAALSAKGAIFYGLDMRGVQLQGAHLEEADLRNCNLKGADLRGVRLARARLDGANLEGANLGALKIDATRFLPADLRNTRMRNVNFSEAQMKLVQLDGADISRSNLEGAAMNLESLQNVTCVGLRGRLAS
ncbi:pentapeptide repeat-containing protein [Asticcacaulis sp. 201]|uniref:pentapeptide repeat-containing protein n=1 Tax=Asticcacaulis sp. 201 TaxID=3028787 RepID=UPI0029169624|nr:pentapeptide repeat-containing protein [Asticcacaulis sp. 201]MDV6332462.1 pentapeptide repeat-containing protein [Asticcacaulis sp. 201]